MKRSKLLLTGLLALVLPLSAFARIERSFTQVLSTQPGGILNVDTQGGDLRVLLGPDHEVRIEARLAFPQATSEAEADAILRDVGFDVSRSGSAVTALARGRGERSGLPPARRGVEVRFVVTVPARHDLNVSTSGGDVEIEELGGSLEANTHGGNLRLGRIAGRIQVRSAGGNVSLRDTDAPVSVVTTGGHIRVGRLAGRARLTTGGGNIDVDAALAAVHASAAGGDVRVHFPETIPAASSLESSGGNIVARVASGAGFRLDARTSGGDVEMEGLAIRLTAGRAGGGRLSGTVNDGDSLLKLRTSGGDIHIERS